MSLVQYSSSSEESDSENEQLTKKPTHSILENRSQGSGESISSFLPAPKNRQAPKREPRVLGKAIKKIAGTSEVNPDNIVLERSSRQVTSFIPSSLRGKQKSVQRLVSAESQAPAKNKPAETELPKVEIFQQVKSRSKPVSVRPATVEIRPVVDQEEIQETLEEEPSQGKKRSHDEEEADNIKEFNVNDFYKQNLELKDQGLLEENKKLHTVTHAKNQLSALIKNAKQDEEVLTERIERNKRLKKERGSKYGW